MRSSSVKILRDDYHIVYIIFLIHGVSIVMPWNMLLNAHGYFMRYKLEIYNSTMADSYYGDYFYHHISITTMLPLVITIWVNIFLSEDEFVLELKVICCLFIEILLLLFMVIMAMVDTSKWINIFFCISLLAVILLNMANGLYQGILYGLAAKMSKRYLRCLVFGQNLSGVISTVAAVVGKFISTSEKMKVIYYFIIALLTLFLSLNTYLALPINKYYRILTLMYQKRLEGLRRRRRNRVHSRTPYFTILREILPQLFNIFLIFVVSMTIYPVMQVHIVAIDTHFFLNSSMFHLVVCFLSFNLCSMLGSLVALFIQWPSEEFLIIPVVLRTLYIPFFLFCNYQPPETHRRLPVMIKNDWAYWITSMTMALSDGYLSVLAVQYIPDSVNMEHRFTAGAFGGAVLTSGISAGLLLGYIWPNVI